MTRPERLLGEQIELLDTREAWQPAAQRTIEISGTWEIVEWTADNYGSGFILCPPGLTTIDDTNIVVIEPDILGGEPIYFVGQPLPEMMYWRQAVDESTFESIIELEDILDKYGF